MGNPSSDFKQDMFNKILSLNKLIITQMNNLQHLIIDDLKNV